MHDLKKLINEYSKPGRYYHTWDHIVNILSSVNSRKMELTKEQLVAILYHDIVYIPGNSDNELQSALLAQEDYRKYPEFDIGKIRDIILATKTHEKTDDKEIDTVLDLDMEIISDVSEYSLYVKNIRREYAQLSDDVFYPARKKFLEGLINRGYIYITDPFKGVCEKMALANIADEIKTLSREGY